MDAPGITILGLGPGSAELLTRQAWQILQSSSELYLRTRQHPVVDDLPDSLQLYSFDHLYESGENFEAVYAEIVNQVLELGRRPQGVIYAVPGHPLIAEATSPEIARLAEKEGLNIRVVEGLSFLEPTFTALGMDPFPHTALLDGLELAVLHVPPFPPSVPAIVAQIHSDLIASEVKLALMSIYPDEHPVQLVHAAGTPQKRVEDLRLFEIDRSKEIGLLTSLFVPPLAPGTAFEEFQEIIAHLRAPDGCPWDREQTHQSLRPHLLEETYEVLESLDADDPGSMQEEFGDLLLQIVLHAQIASEYGEFSMADILRGIHAKIVRRHPHVFGSLELGDTEGVLLNWERLKEEERAANGDAEAGLLDGVARTLPALVQAEQYQKRAARVGFDWPDIQGVLEKLEEELREVDRAKGDETIQDEIGDLLFAVVNLARWNQVDPESALRKANSRFKERFSFIETAARMQGRSVADMSLDEMDALWNKAKRSGG